jgi:hypothetical protein
VKRYSHRRASAFTVLIPREAAPNSEMIAPHNGMIPPGVFLGWRAAAVGLDQVAPLATPKEDRCQRSRLGCAMRARLFR